jgi:ABC-type sulfate/molybdate transport systems ATPase subunit
MRGRSALEPATIELEQPPGDQVGSSKGVALARALAVEPKLLLLDEPFSGLDLANKARLCDEIVRLTTMLELTLLVVAHDPLEAAVLCSRVAVLEGGRIAEIGAFDQVVRHPESATLRAFVAHLPNAIRRTHTVN